MPEATSTPIMRTIPDKIDCASCHQPTETSLSDRCIGVRCACFRTTFIYPGDFFRVNGVWYELGPTALL